MQVSAQFADSLYAVERLQALRLVLWGAASILLGSLLIAFLQLTKRESRLLLHFGAQCALWGVLWVVAAVFWQSTIALRDLAGAVALDRAAWFALGVAGSVALSAAALIVAARVLARGTRAGGTMLGVSVGALTQAVAITVLALQLSAAIVR